MAVGVVMTVLLSGVRVSRAKGGYAEARAFPHQGTDVCIGTASSYISRKIVMKNTNS